jgi:transcriptional regulator with XRE-family HTH domain
MLCEVVAVVSGGRSSLPATRDALAVLGIQIASARRDLGWTAAELAGRLGVSAPLVSRIETGHPSVKIGTVFDAAVLCGVALFTPDTAELGRLASAERQRFALLPQRVRQQKVELNDDF